MPKANIGTNIEAKIKGDKLTLTIDLSQKGSKSKSGKSYVLASTGRMSYLGDLGEDFQYHGLSLNCFKIRSKYRRKRRKQRSESSD